MSDIWWHTAGEGKCDLVLLHGWGLNAQVWDCIVPLLSAQFTLHLVDLPGYGRSQGFGAMTLDEMAERVLAQAPARAVWLGWSLGGLVASRAALMAPERVTALVTVASSPCFSARDGWPGIKPSVLSGFQQQLSEDFQKTVERFLALQTMGTENARQDARRLKSAVLSLPMPSAEALNGGLEILKTADLSAALTALRAPSYACTARWTAWCRAKSPRCSTRSGRKAGRLSWRRRRTRRLFPIRRRSARRWRRLPRGDRPYKSLLRRSTYRL